MGAVVRGGMEERSGTLVADVEVERGEGEGGGRVWEVEGVRRGVEVLEDMAEWVLVGGRTRFARRKVKKAARSKACQLRRNGKKFGLLVAGLAVGELNPSRRITGGPKKIRPKGMKVIHAPALVLKPGKAFKLSLTELASIT